MTFSTSGTAWVGVRAKYKLFEFNPQLLPILQMRIHFYSCLSWVQSYYEMDEVLVCQRYFSDIYCLQNRFYSSEPKTLPQKNVLLMKEKLPSSLSSFMW